jgi:excisionase family DNA binding protein
MLGLKEAAELAGVAESTVYRAAKKGRISSRSGDGGRLLFDPAEVQRWAGTRPGRTAAQAGADERRTEPQPAEPAELARLQALREADAARIRDLEDLVADVRKDRDHWREAATAALRQLADQRPAPARRAWWPWRAA